VKPSANARERRSHSLHRCTTPAEFVERFREETGQAPHEFVRSVVENADIEAVIVGGSIPFGVATAISDVDLMVLLRSGQPRLAEVDAGHKLHNARYVGESRLVSDEVVLLVGGIEVEVQLMRSDQVLALGEALRRGGAVFTPLELILLARVKRGWVIEEDEGFRARHSALMEGRFLDLYIALREYAGALKETEDAWAAAAELPVLALYLGRAAVDKVCCFILALCGYPSIRSKWIRLVESGRIGAESPRAHALLGRGIRLLFPSAPSERASETARYLDEVVAFMGDAKAFAEEDRLFAIAFAQSRQIYDPALSRVSHRTGPLRE
jgi:hypothetical protein